MTIKCLPIFSCLLLFLIDSLGMVVVCSALKAHSSPIQWMWSLELQQTVLNHTKLAHPPCAAVKTPINMHILVGRHTVRHTNLYASFFVFVHFNFLVRSWNGFALAGKKSQIWSNGFNDTFFH